MSMITVGLIRNKNIKVGLKTPVLENEYKV
jgi:hypothetical protein